ncbi:MAG TPA: cation diffusion facilitator family transporter [Gemmatimonadales bacterium]|nr:cation diffusion facilitator family transporter [Gemmatimonadales bacterium]
MSQSATHIDARGRAVRRVLGGLLLANLVVVATKLAVALQTGSLAVFGDVVHSSIDALNNVIGLLVMRVASKEPDEEHPYGHGKFEPLGALVIVVFLSVTIFELGRDAVQRLIRGAAPPQVSALDLGLLGFTLAINVWVAWYEGRAGRRWESELLLADAAHTRADVVVSLGVLLGLALSRLGYGWLDPLLGLVVSLLVARIGFGIVRRSMPTLVDERALDRQTIQRVAEAVEGVRSAYAIRSRSAAAMRFAELTIAVDGDQDVAAAHRIADQVEERLRRQLDLHQVVVHVEPC